MRNPAPGDALRGRTFSLLGAFADVLSVRPTMKTGIMVLAMAAVFAGGLACFGMFSSKPAESPPASCEGLEGQAKADCEKQRPAP